MAGSNGGGSIRDAPSPDRRSGDNGSDLKKYPRIMTYLAIIVGISTVTLLVFALWLSNRGRESRAIHQEEVLMRLETIIENQDEEVHQHRCRNELLHKGLFEALGEDYPPERNGIPICPGFDNIDGDN